MSRQHVHLLTMVPGTQACRSSEWEPERQSHPQALHRTATNMSIGLAGHSDKGMETSLGTHQHGSRVTVEAKAQAGTV